MRRPRTSQKRRRKVTCSTPDASDFGRKFRDTFDTLSVRESPRARHRAKPPHDFFDIRARAERADAEVALAAAAEACAWRRHDARFTQKTLEERPTVARAGHLAPDVWRAFAAPRFPPELDAAITKDTRVLNVEINERCDFALAVRGVEGLGNIKIKQDSE